MDLQTYSQIKKEADITRADMLAAVNTVLPDQTSNGGLVLGTDGTEPVWIPTPLQEKEGNIVGSVVAYSGRGNNYSSSQWTTSAAWTTFYGDLRDANSQTQAWNMATGDGYPNGSTHQMFVNDQAGSSRYFDFAKQQRMGHWGKNWMTYETNNNSGYGGQTFRLIPIRNTTNTTITRGLACYLSGYSTYTGSGICVWTPNTNKYSTASNVTRTLVTSTTSNTSGTYNITVPANTTVVVMLSSCNAYRTTYRFEDMNIMYNLHSLFPTSGDLVVDLRMLDTLMRGRISGDTYTTVSPQKYWNLCAELYGDR